jgi:HIV Tat-specific factor 1
MFMQRSFLSAADSQQAPSKKQQKVIENRAVYATNIPRDATLDEVEDTFKKAGIIEMGVDGKPRIKMYADENGEFNGDVLVVYFKKESIQQAILRIDGWEFRPGQTSDGVVKVQEADMSYKKVTDGEVVKAKLVRKDRKAAERTRAELNR